MEVPLDLAHEIEVDDLGAVHAHEAPAVEARLEAGEGLAQLVASRGRVDAHVVALGAQADDLGRRHEEHPLALAHEQPLEERAPRPSRSPSSRSSDSRPASRLSVASSARARRLAQALVGEGLEQVVDGGDLERVERELVVGRHEDDGRHRVRADLLQHLEAVHARHLHVEEDEVRPLRAAAPVPEHIASVVRRLPSR